MNKYSDDLTLKQIKEIRRKYELKIGEFLINTLSEFKSEIGFCPSKINVTTTKIVEAGSLNPYHLVFDIQIGIGEI